MATTTEKRAATAVVIEPRARGVLPNLKELWAFRDLVIVLVQREFTAKYKQTILGPLWFLVQPIVTAAVFTVVFVKVAEVPTEGVPGILFYMSGLLHWSYFSQTFSSSANAFVSNAALLNKVYFPRLVLPLASSIWNLFPLVLQSLSFAGFWLFFRVFTEVGENITVSWTILLFPLLVFLSATASLGFGLVVGSLTGTYRDLIHVTPFAVQILLYITPLIYPMSKIPAGLRWIAWVNPMAPIIETNRAITLGAGTVNPPMLAVSFLLSAAALAVGLTLFRRVERTVADSI